MEVPPLHHPYIHVIFGSSITKPPAIEMTWGIPISIPHGQIPWPHGLKAQGAIPWPHSDEAAVPHPPTTW